METVYLAFPQQLVEVRFGAEALGRLQTFVQVRCAETPHFPETDDLLAEARGCAVIIANQLTPADGRLFASLPELVAFVRRSRDLAGVDLAAASRHGVLVTRAGPAYVFAVTEWIVGQMVNLARRLPDAAMSYRKGVVPAPVMGIQLAGKTAGIIGFGHIGRHLAVVLAALGMSVLVCDPHAAEIPAPFASADFGELLARADFVICLAALTDATENLMDVAAFARMKPGAFFINAARGGHVDEAALEGALSSGRLAGAALDVGRPRTDGERTDLPSPRLARHAKALATPHIGGLVPEAMHGQAMEAVGQVAAILQGEVPVGAVNGDRATRLSRLRPQKP